MNAPAKFSGVLKSALLRHLLETHESTGSGQLCVIDFGPASTSTISFFNQFDCVLHIADLFPAESLPVYEPGDDILDQKEVVSLLAKQFEVLLSLPAITFDLCLFWDGLNQLDPQQLAAFSQVLKPHLHANTQGYAFAVHNRNQSLAQRQYGILSAGELSYLPASRRGKLNNPHTQTTLNQYMSGMKVNRSVLHGDGRLEVALKAAL
jgi:hypothetical protein